MKKMVLAIALTALTAIGATAQDAKNDEPKHPSRSEMIAHRTERMVERYKLDENQAAKLKELNEKYADVMAVPHRGGGRHPRGARFEGKRPDRKFVEKGDSLKVRAPKKNDDPKMHEAFRKQMESYHNELKGILTQEQMAAFEADREKMMRNKGKRK
jgi:Spy/CpxP family protein refolding chaperone